MNRIGIHEVRLFVVLLCAAERLDGLGYSVREGEADTLVVEMVWHGGCARFALDPDLLSRCDSGDALLTLMRSVFFVAREGPTFFAPGTRERLRRSLE